jgi:beta-glucanase (GH16 family)
MPKGNPYWGAFWLVSPNDGSTPDWPDYGEFDVMEVLGGRPDLTHGTLHYACASSSGHCHTSATAMYNIATMDSYQGSRNYGPQVRPDNFVDGASTTRFVRYGFLWEPDAITWYVDGRPVRYLTAAGDFYRYQPDGSRVFDRNLSDIYPTAPPTISMTEVFGHWHSINLNLAFGGSFPRYMTYGYTGMETPAGYDNGNLAATIPGEMRVDYVRVYQP